MTPQRKIPETLGELAADVLLANELQRQTVEAMGVHVAELAESVEHVARGLAGRPTKRQTLRLVTIINVGALLAVAVFAIVVWASLRAGQRQIASCTDPAGECAQEGQRRTASAVHRLQCFDAFVHHIAATDLYAECPAVREAMVSAGLPVP